MIADTTTPATAGKATESEFAHKAGQAYAVIVAVGGVIMIINAALSLYDRLKAAHKGEKSNEDLRIEQLPTARIWAEENAKANAALFEAAARAEAQRIMEPHIARIDALEAMGGNSDPKSTKKDS